MQTIEVLISTTIWSCQSCPRIWWPFHSQLWNQCRWAWIQKPASSPIFYTVQSECYSTYMYDILWPFMVSLRLWSCPYIHLCKNSKTQRTGVVNSPSVAAWHFFPCAAQWHVGGEERTRLRTYTWLRSEFHTWPKKMLKCATNRIYIEIDVGLKIPCHLDKRLNHRR